LDPPESTV
jgi:glutathionyl-hydroquinone reductase